VATHLFQLAHLDSFSSTHSFVMMTFLCNCGFCTSGDVLKPYTSSRWILVVVHLFQLVNLEVFISVHFYVFPGSFWGRKQCFFFVCHNQTVDEVEV
jgi:hypothetical protein